MRENRETRKAPLADGGGGRSGKAAPKPDMHADRESDGDIVPAKRANKEADDVLASAESVEGREPTKENIEWASAAPDAAPAKKRSRGLLGVREAARRDKGTRFTALLHHLTPELLRVSFYDLKKHAAPGVDGVTWEKYRCDLEARLDDLHDRIHRGAYRNGVFQVKRRSIGKRLRAKLQAIKVELRKRMHLPVRKLGQWLRSVVQGWMNYHAVPCNLPAVDAFRTQVVRMWRHCLRRRSQKARRKWTWERTRGLVQRWIPPKRVLHPHPDQRLIVRG